MLPKVDLPPSRALLAVVAFAFVLPGLIGHDPWKPFDVLSIEIVREMLATGDWIVPSIAGEPWLDDPPLYYWISAIFAVVFGGLFAFHDAARIASGFLVFATLWFLYLAAKEWAIERDRHTGAAAAVLILIGAIGLMVHGHQATPDLAALAAGAAALAALARAAVRPAASGAIFGAALGAAFLATGLVVPVSFTIAAIAAHVFCEPLRQRKAFVFFAVAVPIALVVAASWPAALWSRSPSLLAEWWAQGLRPRGDFGANLNHFVSIASWFAWPAWPLAAWATWSLRRRWRNPGLLVPLAASIASFLAVAALGPAQDAGAIVVLAPLAILASQAVMRLPRGASAALDWFAVMTFTFFASLVWLGFVAMTLGVPPRVANNFAKMAPGFVAEVQPLALAAALLLTAAWLHLVFRTPPSATRGVARWAGGVVLLWGTVATLWMPWVDHQRSYQAVALQLKSVIPSGAPCIAEIGLGITQRAALDYHARIRTIDYDPVKPEACPVLLVQGNPRYEEARPGARWSKIADVGRPGDKAERYRLYEIER
jgi:4-amino-4-deoxy-L-arabinose transferase-like glycosyltransferase